jgi:DNA modification methylase
MKYKIEEIKNKILCGDALEELQKIPDNSIDCIITSPPYWGLRNYQVEGQIGLEPTLEEYLEKLLKITAELKRILKKSGVMFWNHGDAYCGSQGHFNAKNPKAREGKLIPDWKNYPKKCLYLQNWRLILKMIDKQGWILRNVIIWYKPNHMPSSVKDRFTNAYDSIFMLVKNKKYYFELDAVRIPPKTFENRPYGIVREREFEYNTLYPEIRKRQNSAAYNWKLRRTPNVMEWRKNVFNYRVRDAEKKSEQCPQFKATKEEIERYKEKNFDDDYWWNFLIGTSHPNRFYKQAFQIMEKWMIENNCYDYEKFYQWWCQQKQGLWQRGNLIEGQAYKLKEELPFPAPEKIFIGKNPGDVWQIPTQPAPPEARGKHFAMFPENLVEPMILAGCPTQVCKKCGKPRERIIVSLYKGSTIGTKPKEGKILEKASQLQRTTSGLPFGYTGKTIGWTDCGCGAGFEPGIVLDPFMGSGTVAVVAKKLGRSFIGIELNPEYVRISNERLKKIPNPLI